jgi:flagellar hook-associated protein 1 FlgK
MSLTATIQSALTGLDAAQRALSVTADNVAKANTAGYVRKVQPLQPLTVAGQGAGVAAGDVQRIVDSFLDGELRTAQAKAARSDVLDQVQSEVQDSVLGQPGDVGSGIPNALDRLQTTLETLANAPTQGSAAVGAVSDLLGQIQSAASQLSQMRHQTDLQIGQTVGAINAGLQQLADLNQQIIRNPGSADLADQRDALLTELSQNIDVASTIQSDGTATLYTRGGIALLDHTARTLTYSPTTSAAPGTTFGPIQVFAAKQIDPATGAPRTGELGQILVTGGQRAGQPVPGTGSGLPAADLARSPLTSGMLAGLIEARDSVLPELQDRLDALGALVGDTLNAAHDAAVPLPPPTTVSGSRSDFSGFDGASNTGTAYLAVVDRSTGQARTTLAIDLAGKDLGAVASEIDAGLSGYGGASIAQGGGLQIDLSTSGYGLAWADGTGKIAATDAIGQSREVGLAQYFGLNDLVSSTGPAPTALAVRGDILTDPTRLSSAMLDVDPGPPPDSRLGGTGDNRGAQALAAALDQPVTLVTDTSAPTSRSVSPKDYAAEIVAEAASSANRASDAAASDKAVADTLATRVASVSGVNIDEELSKLVLYQKSYAAAARIISATSDLFDTLLAIGT